MTGVDLLDISTFRCMVEGHVITVDTHRILSFAIGPPSNDFITEVWIDDRWFFQGTSQSKFDAVFSHKRAVKFVNFIVNLKFEDLPMYINSKDDVIQAICKLRLGAG